MNKSDWHPAEVKAALEKKGLTATGLSVAHGYDRTAVSKALHRSWPAVERIIAGALGVRPKTIWPSRYDRFGRALRERPSRKATTGPRFGHVQNRPAA